ncbi:MAG: GGDEF domain-containing protein [Aquabacterium sp.]|uniref:GGDEF domain-containing protein n=1 Tax=Aquabacterium sp. TaxID=1872578 RepID=UPI0025BCF336|nr:GGDEF domain-containing protein [Aquabacterium sp.]MBI5924348.1 GGDEF domain-containing protein [Aquabacterium sp.]
MNQIVRLHRDDNLRRDTVEPVRSAAPDSAEATLARGHLWLRFPKTLEAEFAADTLEPRRRLLVSCALLGCLGVVLGSGNVNDATPEIAALVWQLVWVWMALAMAGLLATWLSPTRVRQGWHAEFITTLLGTAMSLLVIWMATASRADTAITHSAMAAIPVMYSCIAARLRFYWSLTSALITFGAYVLFVKGFTPDQAQMATGLRHLMAMSFAFGLLANYAFEHRERRNWLLRRVEQHQRDALLQTSAQLQLLSIQDPLTGLNNRRQFDVTLQEAIDQATWEQTPLALLAIDVDFFKRYNDSHGHPAGDTCLIEIARVLAIQAKIHGGSAARLGGEEFAIILPDHAPDQAQHAGESVCNAVAALRMPHRDSTVADHVTISAGLANWQAEPRDTPQCLQDRADRALYRAKAEGRNKVCAEQACNQADNAPVHLASPMPTERLAGPVDDQAEADEERCQETLEGHFLSLRFPEPLESAYIEHNAEPRRKQLALTALLGLLIFNISAILNRAMFGDIQDSVLDFQVWVSAWILLLTTFIWFTPRPLWREALYSLSTATVALVSTWVFSKSQLTSTLSYSVCLMLIPMFSGVAARQPFWFTCVPSVITSLAVALMLKPVGPVQEIVYGDNLFMIVNNMVYTLILAYTLEHGLRKEWLLARIDGIQRDALLAASQRLKALSVVDPLTGICNRRQFEDDLDRIWGECLDDQRPLGMLIIDVDHFKLYNDKLGHLAGDECLKLVAALISKTAQADKGIAARLGGEEFGVLLPGGSLNEALKLAERIRLTISQACIAHDYAPSRHVTVSIGVASLIPQDGMDRISLFATADKALYEAKRTGRNKVLGPSLSEAGHHRRVNRSADVA